MSRRGSRSERRRRRDARERRRALAASAGLADGICRACRRAVRIAETLARSVDAKVSTTPRQSARPRAPHSTTARSASCSASSSCGLSWPRATPALRGDLRVVPLAEVLAAARSPAADRRPHGRPLAEARRHLLPSGVASTAIADGVPEEFLLGRFVARRRDDGAADLEAFLESRSNKRARPSARPAARSSRA